MVTAARDGLEFEVRTRGPEDGSPVLLLHGFPQRADSWDAVAARLAAAEHRTIAPDQRGYSPGARPRGRAAYALDELAADALAVVDRVVGPGARVHVVGHDWGAVVGWRLGARHADRVRSLTAVSVPPPRAFLRALRSSPRQALSSWYMGAFQLPLLPERLLSHPAALARILRGSGLPPAAAERDAARFADRAAVTGAVNWYRALPLGARSAASEPPVTVPTLFVWSDGDVAVTRAAAERAHEEVTGPYRYVELRGVSHWIPDEAPDALADLVLAHTAEHPG
jgi:pimeloyl-ACP methyl ester carboxylesterase